MKLLIQKFILGYRIKIFTLIQPVTQFFIATFNRRILVMVVSLFTVLPILTQAKTTNSGNIRIATFNVSMDATNYLERGEIGTGKELINALASNHQQIRNIAEIIQITRPDILLLNEFDFIEDPKQGVEVFLKDYLAKSQQGAAPIDYPHYFYAPVNTGVSTPFDLNNDGIKQGNLADAQGFGHFPGHFGMVLLSRYPIEHKLIRTFQNFLWKDLPNASVPIDPATKQPWYSDQEWQSLRLSSKSHWDIPVRIEDNIIHILASHPTPPVFDGDEDRNGARNHDEIRFWHDYITPNQANYLYDDNGNLGGIDTNARFVIVGDQNASKNEGGARKEGIGELLASPYTNNDLMPSSVGGSLNSESIYAVNHTASWGMQADYVLPSRAGINLLKSGIFWPEKDAHLYRLIATRSASSDHRLVWADLALVEIKTQ